jgi:hypothetical protein
VTIPSTEELRARGPWWARGILCASVIWLYLFGGLVILLYGITLVGVAQGQISPRFLLSPAAGWTRHLLVLTSAAVSLVTARLAQKAISAEKRISLKMDASAIYVTDKRMHRYAIELARISQLRLRNSYWLGNRVEVVLDSGCRHHLPQPIRKLDVLIEKITTSAGLDTHRRDGKWNVYSQSCAKGQA